MLKNVTGKHSTSTPIFSEAQRKPVNYFFAHLETTYPADYEFNIKPMEKLQKQKSIQRLVNYTRDQIDNGFKFIEEQKEQGSSKYMKLDIDLAIGAIKDANRSHAAHQLRLPEKLERPTNEEAEAGIAQLRGVLDQ